MMQPDLAAVFGRLPTHLAVNSGRGLQLWFKVANAYMRTPDEWQRIIKGVTKHVKRQFIIDTTYNGYIIDDACAELSHLARLPGTINHKTGTYAEPIMTMHGTDLDIEELLRFMEPPAEPASISKLPPPNSKWYREAVLNGLSSQNRAFIRNGTDSGVESRHKRAFMCGVQLFEAGCDADLASYFLFQGAENSSPNLNLSDPGCIRRLVKEIWKA